MTAFPDGPTASGTSRCYEVSHRTVYRYSDVVTSSYGRGFLTPRDSARQRCLFHELVIEPEAADSSTSRDAYGNLSSYFHVTERHRALSVTSRSIVEVDSPAAGSLSRAPPRGRRGRSRVPWVPTVHWPPSSPWTCSLRDHRRTACLRRTEFHRRAGR